MGEPGGVTLLWELARQHSAERSALRLRLAAAALASTLILLSHRGDALPSLISAGYAVVAGVIFVLGARAAGSYVLTISSALDVAFPTALVAFSPDATLLWVLYAFAIGIAAIRRGPGGAIAATAASLVSYDVALALRGPAVDASLIWALQVLIAVGLIVAELSWARERDATESAALRRQSLAFRAVARETSSEALVEALVAQAEVLCRTEGVWVWRTDADGVHILRSRGIRPERPVSGDVVAWLAQEPPTFVGATLGGTDVSEREAMLRDLVADASRQYVAALAREHLTEQVGAQSAALERILAASEAPADATRRASVSEAAKRLTPEPARVVEAIAGAMQSNVQERDRIGRTVSDLRRLVEAIPIPVVAWDGGGAVALMSRSYAEQFREAPLEAPRDLVRGEVRVTELMGDGEDRRVYRALSVATGMAELASLTVLFDITPEREMLQAREATMASTAHELRHPLTAVHAWAQLMQRNVASIQGQIGQLERLVGDLVSTRPSPHVELATADIDLVALVRDGVFRLRQLTRAPVRIDAPGSLMVRADAQRLAQALDNVLQNAAKYSPPEALIDVTVAREGDEARVIVRDRGIGISADELPFLFERAYRSERTRETGGSGLGLAIARDVVLAHGGRIWAESPGPSHGSTFTISLPALIAATSNIAG